MLLDSRSKSPSHPQLWFIRVEDADKLLPESFLQHVHPTTLQRYQTLKSSKRQKQFLASRWLIQQAAEHFFSVPVAFSQIEERSKNTPRLLNLPDKCFYSLTHSSDWIVFAMSATPIGIDMERKKPRSNAIAMANLFMSVTEFTAFRNEQNLAHFYRLWCYKEAYYKSLPKNQQSHTRFSEIDSSQANMFETRHLYELVSEQFHFTLFSQREIHQLENFLIGRIFDEGNTSRTSQNIQTCWHFM